MPGRETPEDIEEVRATRAAAGLFDRMGTAVLEVAGRDAADYLHRMLTTSVKTLQPGHGALTTILKGDGRLIAVATVHRAAADQFLVLAPSACRSALAAHLGKYLIMEEAEVLDRTGERSLLEVNGPEAAGIVSGALGHGPGDLELFGSTMAEFAGKETMIIRSDSFQLPGFLILCEADLANTLRTSLTSRVTEIGGCVAGPRAREILRVEAGVPEFGTDMDGTTIPLEANLRDAIDFRKGCFPGQEIVARIDNLGHPAKMLVGLTLQPGGNPEAGTALYFGEKETGRITSVADSPTLGEKIALGYVRWDQRDPGTEVTLRAPDSEAHAVVTALPFVG